jgi:hypothetical protein
MKKEYIKMTKQLREERKAELKELTNAIQIFQDFMKKYGNEFDAQDRDLYEGDFLKIAHRDVDKIVNTPGEVRKFLDVVKQVVDMVYYRR